MTATTFPSRRHVVAPSSGDVTNPAPPRPVRRAGRLLAALAASVVSFGVITGLAPPASALVDVGGAYAYETVTCDSAQHTVTLDINTVGYGSGVYGGSDLFPYEVQKPVYVKVWEYVGGGWVSTAGWKPVPGTSHITISSAATTFWYFDYAFQTPSDTFEYRGEWAGGVSASGWYADQNGYQTLTSCVS